jgi:hypothetical protein
MSHHTTSITDDVTPPLRPTRTRAGVERLGYVGSDEAVMKALADSLVDAPPATIAAAAAAASSPKAKPVKRKAGVGALAAFLPEDEVGAAGEMQVDVPDDEQDEDYEDDSSAHEHKPASPASKKTKPKEKAKERVQWGKQGPADLATAVLKWVKAHDGRMPPALKTGKDAKVNEAWKTIAAGVPACNGIDVDKAARASSLKWTNIRSHLKVR